MNRLRIEWLEEEETICVRLLGLNQFIDLILVIAIL